MDYSRKGGYCMAEDESAEYQLVRDYIQQDCHFAELAQLAGQIDGKFAPNVVELTRDIFEIWLFEKLLSQPEISSRSVQEVLEQSTGELLSLSATDFSEYLLQGVFKDDWQLADEALRQKYGDSRYSQSLSGKLNAAKLAVIQLVDHQEAALEAYCDLLKAALVLNQQLAKIA